jgi:hypothetical protein
MAAIPTDRDRGGVELFDPVRTDAMSSPREVGEPATDGFPPPAVPGSHHLHDLPPDEPANMAEDAFRDGVQVADEPWGYVVVG